MKISHSIKRITLLLIIILASNALQAKKSTQYPLILVHGTFGFNSIQNIDYFYKIPNKLRKEGFKVFIAEVSALNSNEIRGEQLLQQVEEIIAITNSNKVNLIGHSQGSPTSRYVAGVAPHLVASVTSIGGVNMGSPVANDIFNIIANKPVQLSSTFLLTLEQLGFIINSDNGLNQDSIAALNSITIEGATKFNRQFPDGITDDCNLNSTPLINGIYYFSWSGNKIRTNFLDITDFLFSFTQNSFTDNINHDGLVSTCSSHLGLVIRDDYPFNHFDQINQFIGLVNFRSVKPISIYLQHASRLKRLGL